MDSAPVASVKRWRLADQPLAVQFLTAGGVVAFFSVISLVLLFSQVDSQTQAARFLSQTHGAVGKLNTLGRDFFRQETAVLEFLRTHDERYLGSVREQRKLWDEGIKAVGALTGNDTPKELELMQELDERYREWLKVSQALIDEARARSATARARPKVPEFLPPPTAELMERESALFKETIVQIDALVTFENRLLIVRDESEKNATSATFTAISVIQIALLIVFGIMLAKLYSSIASPLSSLLARIRRYDAGDLGVRVRVTSNSEIGSLQRSINDMASKIETMVDDLRNLDRMKTEFLSTVSHELRTPLTSIGGYAKLLASGDAGDVTETQKEFLIIIDTNVVRLTHLINDILDVEKMEVGKVQIVREPQDMVAVLKECRDTFGILAQQKGLELRYRVPDKLPPVMGDHSRLVQIFMNLLSNAIKYTEQGFVELVADVNDLAITIQVRDSGVGLTPEEKEKLFEKFYRTNAGLRSTEGGTGLGLAIVRGFVEAHNGSVAVESEPGKGTSFAVTFPIATDIVEVDTGSIVQLEPESEAAAPPTAWERPIWVIDSDQPAVNQMSQIVSDAGPLFKGYRLAVRVFSSVAEIPVPVPADQAPFMVILDPGTDSRDAIPLLRRRLHRTVPILVVSGTVDTAEVFAEGASALLTKPIDEREFLIAVRDLITAKGWRVLVAEKSTDLRILLKRALEQRGFLVDDVERGNQVMTRLEQEEYDLALVDLAFTDVPARELLKVIRREHSRESLPVIVMSGEGKSPPSDAELASWGANASVGKDKGIGGIVDSVCQYLEDRKLIEQPN